MKLTTEYQSIKFEAFDTTHHFGFVFIDTKGKYCFDWMNLPGLSPNVHSSGFTKRFDTAAELAAYIANETAIIYSHLTNISISLIIDNNENQP